MKLILLMTEIRMRFFVIYPGINNKELNSVERLWHYIKQNTIKNRFYDSLAKLENTVCAFLNSITRSSIKSICNYNYL